MTRVVVYPADLGGCGHYRVIWPARALQAEGANVDVVLPFEPTERQLQARWRDLAGSTQVIDVDPPEGADVVLLQRPLGRHQVTAIERLQAHGVRVVVEIDDDFTAIDPRNVAWATVQPKLSPDRNWRWMERACSLADHVVVSTPALAERFGRHGRVSVVRNRVPARYLAIEREPNETLAVGWSGSIETHPNDLQQMGSGFARGVRRLGAEVAVIGTGRGFRRITGIPEAPVVSGWVPLADYPDFLAQLDIGVVPLGDTPFNRAKSWLKGLEMAAVGVPVIASPLPEYQRHGTALMADRPRSWERILVALGDPEFRANMAAQGRAWAAGHTVEEHCGEWWSAWTDGAPRPGHGRITEPTHLDAGVIQRANAPAEVEVAL